MGAARRDKRLAKLLLVRTNGCIGDLENLGNAAIIGLNLEDLGLRVLFGQFEDVLEVCTPPRVNALSVIAYDHDVAVAAGNEFDKFGLEVIGVLIFIHKEMLKLLLVERGDIIRCAKKFQSLRKKIVKVHGIRLLLADFIDVLCTGDLFGKREKVLVVGRKHLDNRKARVHSVAENISQDLRLWKSTVSCSQSLVSKNACDQFILILAIHDRKALPKPQVLSVSSQNTVADRVERSSPDPCGALRQQRCDAIKHLSSRLVRECQQQDAAGRHPLLQEPGDPVS